MLATLQRRTTAYTALAGMVAKTLLIYNWSAWVRIMQSAIGMTVFYFFWQAVYVNTGSVAGLTLGTTITYILLVRVFQPAGTLKLIGEFGWNLRDGGVAYILLRPLDMQLAYFWQGLGTLLVDLFRQLPVAVLAVAVFGLRLPSDPLVWAVFVVSLLLGHCVLFCLDWLLAGLTFFTISPHGLATVTFAMSIFFTGGMVPLDMMPPVLRAIVESTPFAQAVYVPVSLLSGLAPISEAPRLLLTQVFWLAVMIVVSRLGFNWALRRVTVQGG